jgi:hypothetical protein
MKSLRAFFLAFAAGASVAVCAEQFLATYDWLPLEESGLGFPGKVVREPPEHLLIENTNDVALRVQLLRITNPPITSVSYALRGKIRYEGVQGDGFLEMWNIFPPAVPGGAEAQYFTRTLGLSGEMGRITGRSDWRAFVLPFHRGDITPGPIRLEVNLVLPGAGQVAVSSVELVQYSGGLGRRSADAWWSDATGGIIGGVCGALLGCLGSLTGWLASKRKARIFVLGTLWVQVGLAAGLAVLGIVALSLGQPFGVWFVPSLLAAIIFMILPGRLSVCARLYRESELRKMAAADAVG